MEPAWIEPCIPSLVKTPPIGADWLHEIKHDGYRAISVIDRRRAQIFTRRGHDWSSRMPNIKAAFEVLMVKSAVIDGEVIMMDKGGILRQGWHFDAGHQSKRLGGGAIRHGRCPGRDRRRGDPAARGRHQQRRRISARPDSQGRGRRILARPDVDDPHREPKTREEEGIGGNRRIRLDLSGVRELARSDHLAD